MSITVGDLLQAGLANQRAGREAVAEEAYRRILAFDPRQPDALHLLGALTLARGKPEEALALLSQASEILPMRGDIHLTRGAALAGMSRAAEAAAAFAEAARLAPELAAAHHGLGRALAETGTGSAPPHYRRALVLAPDQAVVWNDLGVAMQRDGTGPAAAMPSYGRAAAISPADAFVLRNLAGALAARGRSLAARRRYRQALGLSPADAEGWDGLASLVNAWGELDEAQVAFARAAAIEDPPGEAWSHHLFFLNYLPGLDFADHFRANRRWAARIEAGVGAPPVFANARQPDRRLKLAYVSPDLVAGHNQLAFLLPLLAHHDRERFEVAVYADVARPDAGTAQIGRAADRMVSIAGLSPGEQAARIRADGIDVAVNLCGWQAGARVPFAYRAAPVQVAYTNHLSTTGLRAIDVRLTDAEIDPPGLADPYYTERLVRLDSGYTTYQPPAEAPEVTALPALRNGFVTFGSANQVPKMSAPAIALWARLLARVPDARLMLKAYSLGDPWVQTLVRGRFAAAGVAPERLILVGALPDVGAHFRALGEVDIGLDPFPFVGGKTTCDTLWMGVPVVTLTGICMMGRVGVSMLTGAGLPELIARDEEDYLAIALRLAGDLGALAALRSGLRDRLSRARLFDGPAHTRDLERAYRTVWHDWCRQG